MAAGEVAVSGKGSHEEMFWPSDAEVDDDGGMEPNSRGQDP
jgi:hypothetical protein